MRVIWRSLPAAIALWATATPALAAGLAEMPPHVGVSATALSLLLATAVSRTRK